MAIVANQAHYVDVGGYAPGSMPFGVTEIFQVGLQIPPVRIFKQRVLDQEILALLRENVRTKVEFKGDLFAQHAANNVGEQRLLELFERFDIATVAAHMEEIMDYSERRVRAGISRIKDGTYTFKDYIEGDSISDDLITVNVNVIVAGDEVTVDLTGTSDEVQGSINCRKNTTEACVFYVIRSIADPSVPPNAGSNRPIHVIAPEGSLVNCNYPRDVAHSNIITSHRIVDCLMGALLAAIPERVMAAHHGTQNLLTIGGSSQRTGRPYNYVETYGGGQGALHCQDGMDGVHSHMTNTRNAPVEVIEATYPMLVRGYGLVENSEGPGTFRGGMGLFREITFLEEGTTVTISSDRNKIRPWGVLGGQPAANARFRLTDAAGKKIHMGSKATQKVDREDTIITMTSGGGGWGPPHKRDPEKVRWDVIEGLVSTERAAKEYGVVLEGPDCAINQNATDELRAGMRGQQKTVAV